MRMPFRPHRLARLAAALCCGGALAGCTLLRAQPDESRYFALSSTSTSTIDSVPARPDLHFGLGPVEVPDYLDTQSIVRSGPGGAIEYVPHAFWAEPVEKGFERALRYRASARLGTSHAVAYPWYSTTRVDWKVPVDVLRFEATTDGRAMLVARWSVARTSDGRAVATEQFTCEEPGGADAAALVDALSRCVDRLTAEIAAALAATPPVPDPR